MTFFYDNRHASTNKKDNCVEGYEVNANGDMVTLISVIMMTIL